ncbi:MAG: hypothetical protein NT028_10675 [candidate division Zixibacteria bacterium]|nr:hypothetical protein [candidate division Zixibacteria bacterium]
MAKKFRLSGNVAVLSHGISVTNFALSALLTFSVELLYSLLTIMEE